MSIKIDLPLVAEDEEFRLVKDFDKYAVSNYGRVLSLDSGGNSKALIRKQRILSTNLNKFSSRYAHVTLCKDKQRFNKLVHTMVAVAFLGNSNDLTVNHKNGDRFDNRLTNLEYLTQSENLYHANRIGLSNYRGENNGRSKLTNKDVIEIFFHRDRKISANELARKFNVKPPLIRKIWLQRRWKHLTDTLL